MLVGGGISSLVASKSKDGPGLVTYFENLDFGVFFNFRKDGLDIFGVDLFKGVEEREDLEDRGDEGLRMEYLVAFPQRIDQTSKLESEGRLLLLLTCFMIFLKRRFLIPIAISGVRSMDWRQTR